MITVLYGNDFFVKDYLDFYLNKKLGHLSEELKKYAIVKNPISISVITNVSAFIGKDKVIIWDYEQFKNLESFQPYMIPNGVDIFIIGKKIDKRLLIVKSLESLGANFKEFKDIYPDKVEAWILERKNRIKLDIQPDAIKTLALMYGVNIMELANLLNEFKKMNKVITKEDVLSLGCFINEFSIFELQEEIVQGRLIKILLILSQIFKKEENCIGVIRYFMSFLDKTMTILLQDNEGIKKLGLHPYILKKWCVLVERIKINNCIKAFEFLRLAEKKILLGYEPKFVTKLVLINISKILR